jgi:hypothetical protein
LPYSPSPSASWS